jgi:plasmid maintenance system antidote protein VapI
MTARPNPSAILRRELRERGWAIDDLLRYSRMAAANKDLITEIVYGIRRITPDISSAFAMAFGTSPEFWYNLQLQADHF